MEWNITDEYLEGTFEDFEFKNKLACFDLDGTIIKVKSGEKFPKDENDWKLFDEKKVLEKIKKICEDEYSIIIISNQNGIGNKKQDKNEWITKINNIQKKLSTPLKIYASLEKDKYRKPFPTFFNLILDELEKNNIEIDLTNSFYCGDACGRKGDHSDTDYKFALNCNLKFYTPEYLFLDDKKSLGQIKIKYIDFDKIKKIASKNESIQYEHKEKELVLLVGYQGSGKSTFVKSNKCFNDPKKYTIISMDILKTKTKCLKLCEKSMENNLSVLIDNTNPDKKSRKEYIDLAKKYNYNITCIKIVCDKDIAIHNAYLRNYNYNRVMIPSIAYNIYKKRYEEPEESEGINRIIEKNMLNLIVKQPNFFIYCS